jgi:hypothetical protein
MPIDNTDHIARSANGTARDSNCHRNTAGAAG